MFQPKQLFSLSLAAATLFSVERTHGALNIKDSFGDKATPTVPGKNDAIVLTRPDLKGRFKVDAEGTIDTNTLATVVALSTDRNWYALPLTIPEFLKEERRLKSEPKKQVPTKEADAVPVPALSEPRSDGYRLITLRTPTATGSISTRSTTTSGAVSTPPKSSTPQVPQGSTLEGGGVEVTMNVNCTDFAAAQQFVANLQKEAFNMHESGKSNAEITQYMNDQIKKFNESHGGTPSTVSSSAPSFVPSTSAHSARGVPSTVGVPQTSNARSPGIFRPSEAGILRPGPAVRVFQSKK